MPFKIYIIFGSVFLLIVLFFFLELRKKSLDKFKSIRVGDGQYGNASWASKKEIKESYHKIVFDSKLWRNEPESRKLLPQGIVLGLIVGFRKKFALVDISDSNTLLIGPAGIGKTFYFLLPNIEYAAATGMSFVVTDTKGQTYQAINSVLEKYYGYKVVLIDLRNPSFSEKYNIMQLVNKYMDLAKESKKDKSKVNEGVAYEAKAQKYAKIISKSIIEAAKSEFSGENSYFYDNAEGLITSAILIIAEFGKDDERHIINVFKIIQELSRESKNSKKTEFSQLLELLPDDHKAKWFAGATVEADIKTSLSIFSTALSRLTKFIDSELEQILCFDGNFTAEDFVENKTAVFFTLPEEDTTKHFLFSLFVMQLYRELLVIADDKEEKKFSSRIMFFEDEFGTLPSIQDVEMTFTASRSRNVLSLPIIQSISQLEKNYGKAKAEIIRDNCQNTIFSGFAPTSTTPDLLSKCMGSYTVQTGSISSSNDNKKGNTNTQMMARALMTSDEIKRIPKGDFVILKTGKNPLKTKIPLFEDWGIDIYNSNTIFKNHSKTPKYIKILNLKNEIIKSTNIKNGKKINENTNVILNKSNEIEKNTNNKNKKFKI